MVLLFFNRVLCRNKKDRQKTNVTTGTLLQVPFDLAYWQAEADRLYPNGLPEPHSNDPTQWLFKGAVAAADAPHNLQVAVARLLGYRWPDQPADNLDALAVSNGILCVPPVAGEPAGADLLRKLLHAAYGPGDEYAREKALLSAVGYADRTLDDWLRNGFFEQHCALFHNRPFLWHVWDGLKNGFSAVVNYHKLDRMNLERLIHHYLGDWIKRQKARRDQGEEGADALLGAAENLHNDLLKILEGEDAYDIFVRWKPLAKQPIGWEPDLNDGVRLNIRPFVTAGVLRRKVPSLHWKKDKGRDPETAPWHHLFQGDRINDFHLKLGDKRKAREEAGS